METSFEDKKRKQEIKEYKLYPDVLDNIQFQFGVLCKKQERMAFHRGGISLLTINETFHSLQ